MAADPIRVAEEIRRMENPWTLEDSERTIAAVHRRRRQRRRNFRVGAVATVAVVGAISWWGVKDRSLTSIPEASSVSIPSGPSVEEKLRFPDGSTVTPLGLGTRVVPDRAGSGHRLVRLDRGGALFEVVSNPHRTFVVQAGDVEITVLGTRFSVVRRARDVEVTVHRGRVRVRWPGGERHLASGQSHRVSRTTDNVTTTDSKTVHRPAPKVERVAPTPNKTSRSQREVGEVPYPRASDWRQLADEGSYEEAFSALQATGRPPSSVTELMLAADSARFSGRPEIAVRYLRRIYRERSSDPRAPLAAFTEGRLLLAQLGRPRDAAAAFARARQLAPQGSMAEDALAREVEAWHRAGLSGRARERAVEYERSYPRGLRRAAVRHFGGLHEP